MQVMLGVFDPAIETPSLGLPDEMFPLSRKSLPMTDLDLFIRSDQTRTLLTWREGGIGLLGCYIPGEVVWFEEQRADSIAAFAGSELGAPVTFMQKSLSIHEVTHPSRKILRRMATSMGRPCPGNRAWHLDRSDDFISEHKMCRGVVDGACH